MSTNTSIDNSKIFDNDCNNIDTAVLIEFTTVDEGLRRVSLSLIKMYKSIKIR